eukprot:942-Eustigmatos_ZCMA.PRE.1
MLNNSVRDRCQLDRPRVKTGHPVIRVAIGMDAGMQDAATTRRPNVNGDTFAIQDKGTRTPRDVCK